MTNNKRNGEIFRRKINFHLQFFYPYQIEVLRQKEDLKKLQEKANNLLYMYLPVKTLAHTVKSVKLIKR